MKTNKREYQSPLVEAIMLDNEISLILLSDAPVGPDELGLNMNPGVKNFA